MRQNVLDSREEYHINLPGRGLEEALARIEHLFARSESRAKAADYVQGLLSDIKRKNSWRVAAYAGHASPDGIQWLLTRAPWSADALRDITRAYVVDELGDERAVVVFDDIAFPKRGEKSVGVARQRVGSLRRTENCQVGVFMTYVSAKGTALIDRDLYLPRPEWTEDAKRRKGAGVPDTVRYANKSLLATRMLGRAMAAGVPIGSVVVGQGCTGAPLREFCAANGLALTEEISAHQFVVGSRLDRPVEAQALARLIPHAAFERGYSDGSSAATLRLGPGNINGHQTSLLVRGSGIDHLYFLCHAPQWALLGNLVAVADTLTQARQYATRSREEAGLNQYEVRKWDAWYRHISLSMFAMAYLATTRAEGVRTELLDAPHAPPAKEVPDDAPVRLRCRAQRILPSATPQTIGPRGRVHHICGPNPIRSRRPRHGA